MNSRSNMVANEWRLYFELRHEKNRIRNEMNDLYELVNNEQQPLLGINRARIIWIETSKIAQRIVDLGRNIMMCFGRITRHGIRKRVVTIARYAGRLHRTFVEEQTKMWNNYWTKTRLFTIDDQRMLDNIISQLESSVDNRYLFMQIERRRPRILRKYPCSNCHGCGDSLSCRSGRAE